MGAFWWQGWIWHISCTEVASILGTILAPNLSKVEKVSKKQCPKNGAKKNWIPKHIPNCKMCDPYCKYHLFREVVHPWIQWFWVSFWVPSGVTFSHCLQKRWFEASKNTHLKNISKNCGKRSCKKIEPWGVNPLKRRNWEERSSRKISGDGWQG